MIERNIFLTRKRRIEPLDVVYGSNSVGVKLNVMDLDLPTGSTAVAHARHRGSEKVFECSCTITDNSISFYPPEGFFLPGENYVQIVVTLASGHAVSYIMEAKCDGDIVEGEAFEPDEIKGMLERAEELLAQIADMDAITAEEIDAAYDYGTEYEIIDDKEYVHGL